MHIEDFGVHEKFLEWLEKQSDRDDPIGDLAEDYKRTELGFIPYRRLDSSARGVFGDAVIEFLKR